MVNLLIGSTGAGKTTFGYELSKSYKSSLFILDDWMKNLFWQEMPLEPDYQWFVDNQAWYMDKLMRVESWILKLTLMNSKVSISSTLDLGFTTKEDRKRTYDFLNKNNIPYQIYFLNIPPHIRWQRVQKRNSEKLETFNMIVDEQMFSYMDSIFEPPTTAEGPLKEITI